MDLSFYTAAVGAQMQQDRLNVHGDNIANVNNFAFRARIPTFSALMTGPVRGIEEDLPRGVGSKLEDSELDMRSSGLKETGRSLDFAIDGRGFFALRDPETNELAFTRDGSFVMGRINLGDSQAKEWDTEDTAIWRLMDGNGRYVLSTEGATIDVPLSAGTRAPDWNRVVVNDFDIGIFDFINYNGMQSDSENRLIPVEKNGQITRGLGTLMNGCLELSGVDLANEISKVIETQRSFSYMLRMVTTSDEIEQTVNDLR